MKKKFLAALFCFVFCLSLLSVGATAKNEVTVYHMAVNDKYLYPSESPMPVAVGGTIYVPYTVFDRDVTGVNLGITCILGQAGNSRTLTLSSIGGMLTFDVNAQTCVDLDGGYHSMRAIVRNGRIFIPVYGVVEYFGSLLSLNYFQRPTKSYGVLLRITNSRASLSDERFLSSAAPTMESVYNEYMKSLDPAPTPTTPAVTATPGPSPGQNGEGPGESKSDVRVYLALRYEGGGELEAMLDLVDRYAVPALLLFRPDDLAQNAGLIRRAVGEGHAVGIITSGATAEELIRQAEQGNALLERIVWSRTYTVYAPDAAEPALDALEAGGWSCWTENINGLSAGEGPAGAANRILKAVGQKRSQAKIILDDSTAASGALTRILSSLRADQYSFRLAVETEAGRS